MALLWQPQVEHVNIHSARATSGSMRKGHKLRVQGHVYYNHYRGLTAQGQWCNVPGLPPPKWERHEDEKWIDLTKNLVQSASAARVAAATRQCLQRQAVPTHFCRQGTPRPPHHTSPLLAPILCLISEQHLRNNICVAPFKAFMPSRSEQHL